MEKIMEYALMALDKVVFFSPRILLAILVIWLGFKVSKRLVKLSKKALTTVGFSTTLRPFIASIVSIGLKGIILFLAASIVGADLTGVVAILAATGFAIGMALQGSLGNFASGILILTLNPSSSAIANRVGVKNARARILSCSTY